MQQIILAPAQISQLSWGDAEDKLLTILSYVYGQLKSYDWIPESLVRL